MTGGSKINRKAEAAIAALLTEPTHADAATKAGISEATLQRWLRIPRFRDAYRAARRAILETAIGQIQKAAGQAVETLVRNMKCGDPGPEIRAAIAILDQSTRGLELLDTVDRVAEMERLLEELRNGNVNEPDQNAARQDHQGDRGDGDQSPADDSEDELSGEADGGGSSTGGSGPATG
jgi:hypothetical protein